MVVNRFLLYPDNFVLLKEKKKKSYWDFPGGPVVNNSPVKAEDTGSIPGPGRFHMLFGNISP